MSDDTPRADAEAWENYANGGKFPKRLVFQDKCEACTLLFELYKATPQTPRIYWVVTELFVRLHDGRDYCKPPKGGE